MILKLMFQTQEYTTYPAKDGRPAQSAHTLNCIDMSQPADCRMTENISYRLKDDEIAKHWDKSMDKILEVTCRRIAHSKAGKAMLIGEIREIVAK